MISVPVRSIRSTRPWRNCTLEMRPIGMSMPVWVSTPWRISTRRSVTMKCVDFHTMSLAMQRQATSAPHSTSTTMIATVRAVPSRRDCAAPTANPAIAVVTTNTIAGTTSIFQCGWQCSSSSSSVASASSG